MGILSSESISEAHAYGTQNICKAKYCYVPIRGLLGVRTEAWNSRHQPPSAPNQHFQECLIGRSIARIEGRWHRRIREFEVFSVTELGML
jgi:hypothetical protein